MITNTSFESSENPIVFADLQHIVTIFPSWHFFQNQNVLITGGNGLLASYLVRSLLYANHFLKLNLKVTCLVRSKYSDLSRLKPWLDESSLYFVYGEVETFPFEELDNQSIIIHAASGASPKLYQSDPTSIILANSVGTVKLCTEATRWHTKRFLFFSTGEVYGVNNNPLFSEDNYGFLDPTLLRSCYAESKRCGESVCIAYAHQFGLHTTIARIFHTYGPQMKLDDGRVFADFIRDSLEGEQIKLSSSGDALRCFCYLGDATLGFLYLIVHGSTSHAYNLANPDAEISIRDLATLVSNLTDPPLPVIINDSKSTCSNYLPSKVPRSLPSITKINSIGWEPSVTLKTGFSRTRNSYLTQF